jgi:protein SCO1
MPPEETVDQDTPEERIAELVDAVKRDPGRKDTLVELLPERLPLYAGRSANAVIRIRGYIMAAFEQVGLPEAALPYVLEELESGRDAYLIAAAAKALRGLDGPTGHLAPFLHKAIANIRQADDAVSFDSYRPHWPLPHHTTATAELTRTLDHLRPGDQAAEPHACCSAEAPANADGPHAAAGRRKPAAPLDLELQDQDGHTLSFGSFFTGTPSVVAFFYTRCGNPNKCSLTITKLAELQRVLYGQCLQHRIRTAAITYDPSYDLPARLRAYGVNRGVAFGNDHRLFRSPHGLEQLQPYFELGVNFGQAVVNRHRIELFVLDDEARIAAAFTRLQWDVQEVLGWARGLDSQGGLTQSPTGQGHSS